MSFSSFFHPPPPPLFFFSRISLIISSLLSPPSSLSHRRQTSWPAHLGTTKAVRPCGPASTLENPLLAHKTLLFPLRKPPRGGILWPRALLAPRRAPPVTARQTHPQFCTLIAPSPAARAQTAILPLAPIKAPPEALSSPPQLNYGESPPARGRTTPPPYCPNQPSHHNFRLTPKLHG
jgi:hypothetical protein